MYFKFECTSCGKSLKVREENAGKKARCPYCDASITVPRLSLEDVPVARPRRANGSAPAPVHADAARLSGVSTYGDEQSDGTNVSVFRAGMLGLLAAIAYYAVLYAMQAYDFAPKYTGKFIMNGPGWWVPNATVLFCAWALFILVLKRRKLKRQKASMLFDVLPNELAEDITVKTVDQFVAHIRSLPVKPADSFLVNRVLRGLGHFKVRKSNPEVATMLSSQSEIDANAVESSYTIVKVFIWAIPILGFIGTVIGIGASVSGFSSDLTATGDVGIQDLKAKLSLVTQGLSVAFDTTLIALVMSMIVSFPASALQKAEEDLLNWVDEYCNENLLRRLNDGVRPDVDAEASLPEQVRQAIDAAMNGNHGLLLAQIDALTSRVAELSSDQVGRLNEAMQGLSERTEAAQQDIAASMLETATSLQTYFSGLERGLASLNGVLEKLGEKRVVIESPHARRRSWLARLFHRNGSSSSHAPAARARTGAALPARETAADD